MSRLDNVRLANRARKVSPEKEAAVARALKQRIDFRTIADRYQIGNAAIARIKREHNITVKPRAETKGEQLAKQDAIARRLEVINVLPFAQRRAAQLQLQQDIRNRRLLLGERAG